MCGGRYGYKRYRLTENLLQLFMSDIKDVVQLIKKFRDERDWRQFHNPKNLACSIVIEAAELLQHFQWEKAEEGERQSKDKREQIAEEIGDIAIYLLELA